MSDSDIPLYYYIFLSIILVFQYILCLFSESIEHIDEETQGRLGEKQRMFYDKFNQNDRRFFRNVITQRSIYLILSSLIFLRIQYGFDLFNIKGLFIFAGFIVIQITFFILLPIFVGQSNSESGYTRTYGLFIILYTFFNPLIFVFEHVAAGVNVLFTGTNPLKIMDDTEKEIISMVNESHEKGEIMTQEATMIHNIFEFDDKDAKDIMVHRGDIVAIDGNENLGYAVDLFLDSHYSRFPVFIDDLDNIIGIIHMRELMEFSLEKVNFPKKIKDIEGIMQPASFIPETHSINTLFTHMQNQKTHLVLIKDEYGQTSGLVTLEDIIEEIMGNIFDEHDKEELSIIDRGRGIHIMFGKTELSEVAKCLEIEFDTEDIETLNGFLIKKIGRIPKEHETIDVEYGGYLFKVMDVKGNLIQGVKVQRLLEEESHKC